MTRPNRQAAARRADRIAATGAQDPRARLRTAQGGTTTAAGSSSLAENMGSTSLRPRRVVDGASANQAEAPSSPVAQAPRQPVPPQMALQRAVVGEPDWVHRVAQALGPEGAKRADVASRLAVGMANVPLGDVLQELVLGRQDTGWRLARAAYSLTIGYAGAGVMQQLGHFPDFSSAQQLMALVSQPVLNSRGQVCTPQVAASFERISDAVGERMQATASMVLNYPEIQARFAHLPPEERAAEEQKRMQHTAVVTQKELLTQLQAFMKEPEALQALANVLSDDAELRSAGAEVLRMKKETHALFSTVNEFDHARRTDDQRQTLLVEVQKAMSVLMSLNAEGSSHPDPAMRDEELAQQHALRASYGLTRMISTGRMNTINDTLQRKAQVEGLPEGMQAMTPLRPGQRLGLALTGNSLPIFRAFVTTEPVAQLFLNPEQLISHLPGMPSAQELVQEMLRIHPETTVAADA
jgi:hypothetical protein